MTSITVPLPHLFSPRSYQLPLFEAVGSGRHKRAIVVAHRRAGKDLTALSFTITQMVQRVGLYLHLLPFNTQARKIIWHGQDREGVPFLDRFPASLIASKHENDMRVVLKNNSVWQLAGTDNIDALRGTNPIGIVFSEFGDQDPLAWRVIQPILRENGGWAIFIGTPKGANHFHTLWEMARRERSWFTQLLTINDTCRDAPGENGLPIMTEEDYQDEIAQGMDEEFASQEYKCSFAGSTIGSYYGRELARYETRQRGVPFDARYPVFTGWDLGLDDHMAIWFWQMPSGPDSELRFINYLEGRQEGIGHYIKLLKEKPYIYAGHALPWDASKHEMSGETIADYAEGLGLTPLVIVPKTGSLAGDINRVRIAIPRCLFDKEQCERGLSCLMNYQKEIDTTGDTFKAAPKRDWSTHGADAFRTAIMSLDLFADTTDTKRQMIADAHFTGFAALDNAEEEEQEGQRYSLSSSRRLYL